MKITGKTKIIGILGYPIEHTLSPVMHNAAFSALGLDYVYVAFQVAPFDLKCALSGLSSLGIAGVNVTIPHKETIVPLLDEVDQLAKFIGAVNTVKVEGESGVKPKLVGYNTDAQGFWDALKISGGNPKEMNVLLLGAGGAARAAGVALMKGGISGITISNRTRSKANHLAATLAAVNPYLDPKVIPWEPKRINAAAKEAQLIVNATALGLEKADKLPIAPKTFHSGQIVYDLIYRPTWLQERAASQGAKVLSGKGMLLYQGMAAFKIWTGREAPREVMEKALEENGQS